MRFLMSVNHSNYIYSNIQYISIYLSIYLCIYLSIYLSIYIVEGPRGRSEGQMRRTVSESEPHAGNGSTGTRLLNHKIRYLQKAVKEHSLMLKTFFWKKSSKSFYGKFEAFLKSKT